EHPLREGFHGQWMLALYRSGRQSDALSAYRDLHRLLRAELGIEPSAPLRELHTRILRQDPALDWRPPGAASEQATDLVDPAARPVPSRASSSFHEVRTHSRRRRLAALAAVLVVVGLLSDAAPGQVLGPPAAAALLENGVSQVDATGKVVA